MATQREITNAFDGIAPQSASASSSSSSKYDIFINHRGPDCKHKLASTVYHTLDLFGLRVFLDQEELELGDKITSAIEEAMRSASVHIAIFSRTYAESAWCLAELSFMLKTGTKIISVFYYVDPSDLRWPDGKKSIYANAFAEHERKNRYSPKKLQEWKMAVQQVSYLSGCIIHRDNDDEGKLLRRIVECALLEPKKKVPLEKTVPLEVVATHPVGLDEAVKDFNSRVELLQTDENLQIVGIVGMGGSGKTTLAAEIYNRKCSDIDKCSFLSQVRDAASKDALQNLQRQLLRDLGIQHQPFDSIMEGKRILARTLKYMTVLIVLDDVDDADQMDDLLPAKDSLRKGSFILVTTREREVLTSKGISCIYQMRPLEPLYAKQLFCKHAFLQPYSNFDCEFLVENFKDLIEKFSIACEGLPLSLKVLGAQLNGKSKEHWESQLDKISKILPKKIKERLQVSYDALDTEQQEIFLDTACFFIGEQPDLAITVWDGAGWSGLHSWESLVNKCLVEVDQLNHIKMHDHLRDMGREIAREHSPSRLWLPQQIAEIQQGMPIRGIMGATADTLENCMEIMIDTSRRLKHRRRSSAGLQLLDVKENDLTGKFSSLLEDLVWLRWSGFPDRNLPLWLLPANLRALELRNVLHLEELWDDNVNPPLQLRELIISCNVFQYKYTGMKSLPRSIGNLNHLKKLVLPRCGLISSLPEEFCFLRALEHLVLAWWDKLSSLPTGLGNLASLRHLDLSECAELRTLPDSFKQLKNLQFLDLSWCQKLTLTSKMSDMLEKMTKLQTLRLSGCRELQELPHLRNQASLRELCVDEMRFRDVPSGIGDLRKLEGLKIGSELFTSLPTFIENMSSLTQLSICGCEKLESLPNSIGNLSCLIHLSISYCTKLQSLPDSVGRLNLLKVLHIKFTEVEFLPEALGQLTSLQTLEITNCPLRELAFRSPSSSFFCKLKMISLCRTRLSMISFSEDSCPSLESLNLCADSDLTEINTLPKTVKFITLMGYRKLKNFRGIRGLTELQNLNIYLCPELDELPSLAGLTSIKEISIRGCPKVEKIQGLQHLRSLEALNAGPCCIESLEASESGIESLERLRRLVLVADSRSAIERCIRTLWKWPGELVIYGRAVCGVQSVVESLALSLESVNLQIIHSTGQVQCPESHPFNALIVCFVINSSKQATNLMLHSGRGSSYLMLHSGRGSSYDVSVKEGMWVVIGMFTQNDCSNISFNIWEEECDTDEGILNSYRQCETEKGMLVTGQELRVKESFRRFLALHLDGDTDKGILNYYRQCDIEKGMLVTGQELRVKEAFSRFLALLKI